MKNQRLFKQKVTDAKTPTTSYRLYDVDEETGLASPNTFVDWQHATEEPNTDLSWDSDFPVFSDQLFTSKPGRRSHVSWRRNMGGPDLNAPVEAIKKDTVGEYSVNKETAEWSTWEPSLLDRDDISLMELDPEVTEVPLSAKNEVVGRRRSPLVERMQARSKQKQNQKLSQQFDALSRFETAHESEAAYDPSKDPNARRLPGMDY